ncbi:MAG TPA: formate dehydrogenase, partial [Rhodobacteraceae bacterium]|nr:formate dehydrogenase [Paracoccaceae bacterium]
MTKHHQPKLDTSPVVSDEIRRTTCYMCACRCGINVHMKDGKVKYIEGNRDHPVNKGVLCAKGSAGVMQHYAPSRLRNPMKRVGERGEGKFEDISWEEAFDIAVGLLKPIREKDPKKLAFFTGRDQSQSMTGWWAQNYGTLNYAAHGGFCSVNMAAGGIYTMGGAFWEFGAPDWDRAKLFMIFGVAEDHDSNPIKMGLGKLKANGAKIIAVNPIRSGYNAIADEWVGITPGTDGLFILSLIHELLKAGKVDLDYLIRYTNMPFLVNQVEGSAEFGLFVRDADNNQLVWDRATKKAVPYETLGAKPAMSGMVEVDGIKCRPAFELLAEKYLTDEYTPEAVEERVGIPAARIRSIASDIARVAFDEEITLDIPWTDWKGEKHDKMIGRPVAMHAMRGISAHSNGFQTARALHILQIL